MCDFKPGDEVVCVDDQWTTGSSQDRLGIAFPLTKGAHYTVSYVDPCPQHIGVFPSERGKPAVFIDGARNIGPKSGIDIGFKPSRFRKVQRRRYDAAVERLKSLCDDPGKLIEKTHAERVAGMQEEFRMAMRSMFGEWGDVE